ncbi:hypothetical protein [Mammaliicoccus lentus]|uniref:hypothetical protein n=1 Tax=Mammaliicoccus lentus TaxID=42858 RepID=UPI001072BF1D|nr:hypothetical protein [Mammaliicoccus lentus]MBF0793373.1 hypothetical protein [Mammaliicoccus lentus]TFV17874.1 hypothetical protein E4T78_01820 [Mammaliicoccus lentus]
MGLKVIQSYHGTGGREGYKYEVEKLIEETGEYMFIGELKSFPLNEQIVELNGIAYEIVKEYDRDELPTDEENEVLVYELERYTYPTFHKLEWK